MRTTTLLWILALLAVVDPAPVAAEVTALVGATVIDATGAPPLADAVVVIDGDRIAAVGARADTPVPDGAEVIQLDGAWIVPGLVDPHIHFFQSAGLYTRPDIVDLRSLRAYEDEQAGIQQRMEGTFRRYLASGVTAVVDVGGPMWNFDVRAQARDALAAGQPAPRVAVAGPLISTVDRPQLDLGDPPIIRAETPRDARALVRAQLARDPDLIKIWFILPASGDETENLDVIRAAIDTAHRGGARVAVHATQLRTARAAIEAGADILVHSVDDEPIDDATLALMRERDTLLTTTLVVYEGYAEVLGQQVELLPIEAALGDPAAITSWGELASPAAQGVVDPAANAARVEKLRTRRATMMDNLRALLDAGVSVNAGTDAGNVGTLHGPSIHRELQLWIEAGATPEQALIGVTREAARVFAAEPEFGTVEPGKRADLLVLDADPLADVANLQAIRSVVLGGTRYTPDELLPPSPEVAVQRQLDAYNARDLDAFLAPYAEDVVLARAGVDGAVDEPFATSREEMAPIYRALFDASPQLHCHLLSRTVSGEYVIDHEFVTGMRGGPPVRAVAVYHVVGGVIRSVRFLPKE